MGCVSMGVKVVALINTPHYNYIMKSIKTQYTRGREWLFRKDLWKRFYSFAQLPELKFMKTVGFVVSCIL
jgi:hypothetical protein